MSSRPDRHPQETKSASTHVSGVRLLYRSAAPTPRKTKRAPHGARFVGSMCRRRRSEVTLADEEDPLGEALPDERGVEVVERALTGLGVDVLRHVVEHRFRRPA